MWEFLTEILRTHGLAAVAVLAIVGGCIYAVVVLWQKNQELHTEHRKLQDAEHLKRSEMREAHERELVEVRTKAFAELREYATKLDALHEKRAQESQAIVREAVSYIGATKASVDRITEAVQTLREVIRKD